MMGSTHIVVGIASALAVTAPTEPQACITAILGSAIGGVLSDIDLRSTKRDRDALYTRLKAAGVAVAALLADGVSGQQMLTALSNLNELSCMAGVAFALLCTFGIFQEHRGFTHSIIGWLLYSGLIFLVYPPLAIPFAVGFLSHMLLDILNKKPLRLFYPFKGGLCLKLCYSNKLANRLFFLAGCAGIVLQTGSLAILYYLPI